MKLNYFFSIVYFSCPSLWIPINIRHFIGHLLIHDPILLTSTSCQASPSDKNFLTKRKTTADKRSYQGIFPQLCCLVGSNFRNLFSLVLIMNSAKRRKLKVSLPCCSWAKTWKFKKEKQTRNKTKEKQKFLFQFGVHRNVLPLKFPVTLN